MKSVTLNISKLVSNANVVEPCQHCQTMLNITNGMHIIGELIYSCYKAG